MDAPNLESRDESESTSRLRSAALHCCGSSLLIGRLDMCYSSILGPENKELKQWRTDPRRTFMAGKRNEALRGVNVPTGAMTHPQIRQSLL
jgi:hypothetical protein